MDENGFPTNPAYLEAQGLDLVSANRQLVELQQQMQDLQTVLTDPAQRAQFLQALEQGAAGGGVQRPTFPGDNPQQQQGQFDPANLQAYYQQMQQAAQFGFPLDNLDPAFQAWDSIPNDAWRALANDLIRGAF